VNDAYNGALQKLRNSFATYFCRSGNVSTCEFLCKAFPPRPDGTVFPSARPSLRFLFPGSAGDSGYAGRCLLRIRVLFIVFRQLVGSREVLRRFSSRTVRPNSGQSSYRNRQQRWISTPIFPPKK